jgi:hypothetical protein
MIDRVAALAVMLCLGCSEAGAPAPSMLQTAEPASSAALSAGYCEFALGQAVPARLRATETRVIPTEGEERVFSDYLACQGRTPITVEVRDAVVWSIRIEGAGNCIEDSICVGHTYQQFAERFPAARRLLSREEGTTFSLLVRDGLTIIFPADNLPERCFARPESCTEQIQRSRSEAIFLYGR